MASNVVSLDKNVLTEFLRIAGSVAEKLTGRELVIVISVFVAGWIVSKAIELGYDVDISTEDIAKGKCKLSIKRSPAFVE